MRFSTRAQNGRIAVTLSRRVLLGTVAAATVVPASRGRAQQEPIRIGVLNDQSGLYRDFGGPTSVLAARMRSEERRVGKECRSRWSPYH